MATVWVRRPPVVPCLDGAVLERAYSCIVWVRRRRGAVCAPKEPTRPDSMVAPLALLGYSGAVHRRKTTQATSLVCWLGGESYVRGWSNEAKLICSGGIAL